MSKLISQLPLALSVGPGDYLVLDQGSPPVTRLATVAQYTAASGMSTGAVGVVSDPKASRYFSQLPLASQVYLNDQMAVDQGTPPITRRATVSQVFYQSGTSGQNSELDVNNVSQRLSALPLASACSPQDFAIINQIDNTGNPITRRVPLSLLAHACSGGPTWTLQTTGLPASSQSPYPVTWAVSGAMWTGSAWCAVGYELGNGNNPYSATSPDGLNWTAGNLNTLGLSGYAPEYCVNLGRFVTYSGTSNAPYSMDGGVTWQFTNTGLGSFINFTSDGLLSAGNGVICGCQNPSTTTITRLDTSTGLASYHTIPYAASSCVFDGTNHVAFGLGHSSYSPDGITWNAGGVEVTDSIVACAGNGIIIAAGATGGVSRSTNSGQTWTAVLDDPIEGGQAWSCVFAQGEFIIVAAGGYVYTSPDGLTWTAASAPKVLPYLQYNTHWYIAYNGAGKYIGLPAGASVPSNYYATGVC